MDGRILGDFRIFFSTSFNFSLVNMVYTHIYTHISTEKFISEGALKPWELEVCLLKL